MVADSLVVSQHFRIQDGGLHVAVSLPHAVNLVLTELTGYIVNPLFNLSHLK